MAILINLFTRRKIVLRASHTFGRHPHNVQTLLSAPDTSQIHASMRWNANQWEMIDHSRNGSSINDKRLPLNCWTELQVGQQIRFGKSEESCYQVLDLAAPAPLLFCDAGDGRILLLDSLHHLLPDSETPALAISRAEHGNWVLDQGEQQKILEDGQHLEFGGQQWEFVCSPEIQTTAEIPDLAQPPGLHEITFHFNVSRNEEHVSLKIGVGEHMYDLFERVHHYCLVVLARQRLEDREKGLDPDTCGWIEFDKFARMLGLDPSHVNIQIFRARHQLIETIPETRTWPALIERKRGVVRFGPFKFDVVRGSTIQAESN